MTNSFINRLQMLSDGSAGSSYSSSDDADDSDSGARIDPASGANVASSSPFNNDYGRYPALGSTPSVKATTTNAATFPTTHRSCRATAQPSGPRHTRAIHAPSALGASTQSMSRARGDEYVWSLVHAEGALPAPSCCHSLVAFQDRYLILFGGGSELGLSNAVHVFDIDRNTWTLIETTGDVTVAPRLGHSAVVYHDTMIVYGGQNVEEQVLYDDVLQLDLHTWQWTVLDHAPSEPHGPGQRRLHTAHVMQDRMYVFMGDPCSTQSMFWYFDLVKHTWHNLQPAPLPSPSMVTSHAHGSSSNSSRSPSGSQAEQNSDEYPSSHQNDGSRGNHSNSDLLRTAYDSPPVTRFNHSTVWFGCPPFPLCGHGSVVEGEYMYLFGGYRPLEAQRASMTNTAVTTSTINNTRATGTTLSAPTRSNTSGSSNVQSLPRESGSNSISTASAASLATTFSYSTNDGRAVHGDPVTAQQGSANSSALLDVFRAHRSRAAAAAAATTGSAPASEVAISWPSQLNESREPEDGERAAGSMRYDRMDVTQQEQITQQQLQQPSQQQQQRPAPYSTLSMGVYSNTLYRYHFPTNTWSPITTTPVRNSTAALSTSTHGSLSRLLMCSSSSASSLLSSSSSTPMPRYSSAMGIYDGQLYLFGGDANHAMALMYFGDFWSLDTRAEKSHWVEHTAGRASRLLQSHMAARQPSSVYSRHSNTTSAHANADAYGSNVTTSNDNYVSSESMHTHVDSRHDMSRHASADHLFDGLYVERTAPERSELLHATQPLTRESTMPTWLHGTSSARRCRESNAVSSGRPGPRSGASCAVARAALYIMGGEEGGEDHFMTYTNSLHRYPLGLSYALTLRENCCRFFAQNNSNLSVARSALPNLTPRARELLASYICSS